MVPALAVIIVHGAATRSLRRTDRHEEKRKTPYRSEAPWRDESPLEAREEKDGSHEQE
jgi:hypothetical protein